MLEEIKQLFSSHHTRRERIHVEMVNLVNQRFAQMGVLISEGFTAMSLAMDTLKAQVAATKDPKPSTIKLLQGISAQLQAAKDDPVKIQALAEDIRVKTDSLAEAVAANPTTPPANA